VDEGWRLRVRVDGVRVKRGEIERAIERYNDRKDAGGIGEGKRVQREDVSRRMLSGLDLDYDEIQRLKVPLATAPMEAIKAGLPVVEVMSGQWFDGLITGLLLAESRSS